MGTSLVVQRLRIYLAVQGTRVQSLLKKSESRAVEQLSLAPQLELDAAKQTFLRKNFLPTLRSLKIFSVLLPRRFIVLPSHTCISSPSGVDFCVYSEIMGQDSFLF